MSAKAWDEDYDLTDMPPGHFYLDCGCWSAQSDHTCMPGGRPRPSYCFCGVPDDCMCPSPSERDAEYVDMRDVMQGWVDGLLAREKEIRP